MDVSKAILLIIPILLIGSVASFSIYAYTLPKPSFEIYDKSLTTFNDAFRIAFKLKNTGPLVSKVQVNALAHGLYIHKFIETFPKGQVVDCSYLFHTLLMHDVPDDNVTVVIRILCSKAYLRWQEAAPVMIETTFWK